MATRFYSAVAAETTLVGSITGASVNITVASAVGLPLLFPYTLSLDYEGATMELVQVTAAAGPNLTVTRAFDSTSAQAHNAGARVRHVSTAQDFRDSRDHENATSNIHGLGPGVALVGDTTVQTLTNKTLTNPTINAATINGNVAGSPTFTGTVGGSSVALVRLDNTTDASATSTNHAFQIGQSSGANMRMDNNELMAVNNGVMSTMALNAPGGNVFVFNDVAADSVANSLSVNGTVDANLVAASRASATAIVSQAKADADAQQRFTMDASGRMLWGAGAGAGDTNLYRNGANTLHTDDALEVDGALTVGGISVFNAQVIGNNITNSTGIEYRPTQTGTWPFTFFTQTSATQAIVFPTPFSAIPIVHTNINSGDGSTSRWGSRAISITTNGFTLFVFRGDGSDPAATWASVDVQWAATAST